MHRLCGDRGAMLLSTILSSRDVGRAGTATGAIGFSARRENRIEIEIATRWKSHFRVITHANGKLDKNK